MQHPLNGIRRHLSYGNIVATLALFLALGGVSYAAATLPKNSVSSKSIKKNAVTNAKIKNNAVTGAKVKNSSLTGSDVKNNSISGAALNPATLGTVPSAASAARVDTVVAGTKKASPSPGAGSLAASRAAAPEILLASHGQVSVYAKCFVFGTTTYAEVIAAISTDFGSIYGYSVDNYEYQVGPATPESDRRLTAAGAGADSVDVDYAQGARVFGADGRGLMFDAQTWVQRGTASDAPSHTGPDECSFQIGGVTVG